METGSPLQAQAKKYQRIHLIIGISEAVAAFILLGIFMVSGGSQWLKQQVVQITRVPILVVGAYFSALSLVAEVMDFPVSLYAGYILEHKFNLSNQSLRDWLVDHAKGLGLEVGLGLVFVELLYYLLRHYPYAWWWIGGIVFSLIFVILANLAPVLLWPIFFKFTPLADGELKQRLLTLAAQSKTKISGVFEMDLGRKSKKANAGLVGLGNTRRIIISDTLRKDYSPEEIEVVFAHELGHHVHHHLTLGILVQMALTFFSFYLVDIALRWTRAYFGLEGVADIAGFPLLILVTMLVVFLALPVANMISRKLEYVADNYALSLTGKYESFISTMEKLAKQNLAEISPNPIIEFVFYSHPSVAKRILNCRQQRKQRE